MFLIENRCSDTTDIDELNSRDLRKRMKYRIKLLSDLRQRFRKEYLSELIQKQNDNRVREPRIGEMVLIGNDNKKRLSWPIAKIIELIPGRDGEIRTVRLKTQHGTVIRPVQRIFPLEVQAIANSDKELKEESISVKSTKSEKVLNTNDAIVAETDDVVTAIDDVGGKRKPDEDVDTTLLFPNSVTQGVCRNTCDGHRFCALARLISHTHSEEVLICVSLNTLIHRRTAPTAHARTYPPALQY
ncbi:DUF5641 domain-containing protein [Trichonephila clavipes]|nr:DUF5641 domain-containing protein [Trichonephila clavipes]